MEEKDIKDIFWKLEKALYWCQDTGHLTDEGAKYLYEKFKILKEEIKKTIDLIN